MHYKAPNPSGKPDQPYLGTKGKSMFANLTRKAAFMTTVGLLSQTLTPTLAHTETIDELKEMIKALDQKVKVLERQQELDKEKAADKGKTAPSISAGASGFSLRSADTNFVLRVRGYAQVDGRFYTGEHTPGTSSDTFLIRRVRPTIEGTVYEKYDFRMMFDFGSGTTSSASNNGFLQDAYVAARFLPEFQVQVGKFKEPVGLERIQSAQYLTFVERGYPTQLVPNRDVGVQVLGDIGEGRLNYSVGVFNGVADGGSGDFENTEDEKDIAARVFFQPFKLGKSDALKNLGFGVAGTYGHQEGALRTYSTPGQQRLFGYRTGTGASAGTANVVADGDHWRLSPQAYYYWGPFGLLGEYVFSDQRVRRDSGSSTWLRAQNTAWQIAASYILTGEDAGYKGFTPRKNFNPAQGGWGAFEIAARYGQLQIDRDLFPLFANPASSPDKASSWAIGLNWYLNKNVKVNLDYEQTIFQGGGSTPLYKNGEQVVMTRAQFGF